jgi:hypothetical protein
MYPGVQEVKGTCQACERVCKLPGGFVASHGYTRELTYHKGVCAGSGHPPYEVSCEAIPVFIRTTEEHRDWIRLQATMLRNPALEPRAWIYMRTGWHQVDIIQEGKYCYFADMRVEGNALEIATGLNQSRVDAYDVEVAKLNRYITRQQFRLENWRPRETISE